MSTTATVAMPVKITKGERTKRRIAMKALELFSERGFNGASLRDIAASAGITHAGLLHHFDSKDQVLLFALQLWDRAERVSFDSDEDSAVTSFVKLISLMDLNSREPERIGVYIRISSDAVDTAHPAYQYFSRRYDYVVAHLESRFAQFMREHPDVPLKEPPVLASELVALMDGLQMQWLLAKEKFDLAGRIHTYLSRLGIPLPDRSDIPVFTIDTKE